MAACTLRPNPVKAMPEIPEAADKAERPEIGWFPSFKVYKDRVERLKLLEPNRPTTLPPGWPLQVNAERAWSGSDFKSENDYIFQFTPEDLVEIEAGLAFFKGTLSYIINDLLTDTETDMNTALPGDLGPDDVNKDTFPLPSLGSRLEEVSKTVHDGRGFVVLRGLQPDNYSNFNNILLYLGVTSYIAETRGLQDFDGRMLRELPHVMLD